MLLAVCHEAALQVQPGVCATYTKVHSISFKTLPETREGSDADLGKKQFHIYNE